MTASPLAFKFAPLAAEPGAAPAPVTAEGGRIAGWAAVFAAPDRGGDVIAPGAFAASLARRPSVKLLWQHDPAQPIGVWDRVEEDARGLRVEGRLLPGVARAREALALVAAGALDGLSIGYRAVRAERQGPHRLLTEIELWEISLVTFPMNEAARAAPAPDDPALAEAIRSITAAFA